MTAVPIHFGTVNGQLVRFFRGPSGFEVMRGEAKPEAAE